MALSSQVCARSPPTRPDSSVSKEGEFAGQEDLRNHFIFLFLPAQEVQLQFRPDLDKGRVVGEVTRDGSLLPGCHLGGGEQAAHVDDDIYGNDDDSVDEDDYLCSIEEQATHPRKRRINPILRARPTIYYGTCFRGPSNGKQKSQKEHF